MKKELLDILVCPTCKGKLLLTPEKEDENEILSGLLHCAECNVNYPITDSIPNFLPKE